MTETRVCIDLFSGLGGFSQAFRDDDEWDVYEVDIEAEFGPDLIADISTLTPADLLDLVGVDRSEIDVFVILASPPCTFFSTAGNHDAWDAENQRPLTDDARDAVLLVYHAVGLIKALDPDYWFLENPQGRLGWFLGPPTGKVTYCQYGRQYMKRTHLWGEHPPMTYRTCQRNATCHEANLNYDGTSATRILGKTPEDRAKVPEALSREILEAVESVPEYRQDTLAPADRGGG